MSGRGRGIEQRPAWMSRGDSHNHRSGPPPPFYNDGPPRGYEDRRGPPVPYDDRRGGGGGPMYDDRRDFRRDRPYPSPPARRGPPPPRGHGRNNNNSQNPNRQPRPHHQLVQFKSYEEERDWVEDRRRKRLERVSKWDVPPTAEQITQLALQASMAMAGTAATNSFGAPIPTTNMMAHVHSSSTASGGGTMESQQTRHARRLYLGNLPLHITEQDIHDHFSRAIETSLRDVHCEQDPILSVYINQERHFCFLEFKTVEMTTACLGLDGLEIQGQPIKIKRPNDYNPATAPTIHPMAIPQLDVSKLGVVASAVQDGPNKIFIGGLHYHLTDAQVLELLAAFGKIKAFHLVKNTSDDASAQLSNGAITTTSKGYCFVEYVDPNVTAIAIQGLNGMDIGGGKSLTARLAGQRAGVAPPVAMPTNVAAAVQQQQQAPGGPPVGRSIVAGYDVEALVDAAPQYFDSFRVPLTRIVPIFTAPGAAPTAAAAPAAMMSSLPPPVLTPPVPSNIPTRILVLLNMVTDEDLATDDDYQGLFDEVRAECAKYGSLKQLIIPRVAGRGIEPSAIRKVFLEYASVMDAQAAQKELAGRQFGDSVVEAHYYSEADFAVGKLR
jgi:splicing factor U2AF subunit